MKKRIVQLSIGLGVTLLAGTALISYLAADALVHGERYERITSPEQFELQLEQVRYPALDDPSIELVAWYAPPADGMDGQTLIFVHGFQADGSWLLSQAQFLIKQGYGALIPDLRNNGLSGGDTTYFSDREWRDIEASLVFLANRPEVNSNRLGIMGRSMGGAVAIRAQAELQAFQLVIAQSTFANAPALIDDVVPLATGLPAFPFAPGVTFFASYLSGTDLHAIDSVAQLARFPDTPLLVMHGTEDDWIPFHHSRQLYEAHTGPKTFYAIDGAKHFPVYDIDPAGIESVINGFVLDHL